MIEQVLAERFHAVVVDEPPMGRDPDEFVDRLIRRRRSRLAVSSALGVAVIATATFVVSSAFGGIPAHPAAPVPTPTLTPTLAPTQRPVTVEAVAQVMPAGKYQEFPVDLPGGATVLGFVLDQPGTDRTTVQIRRDDVVLFQEDVAGADGRAYRFATPVVVEQGQVLAVAVRCWKSATSAGLCRADVTFSLTTPTR